MRLFDSHCHLQDERLAPHLEAVLRRAAEAGVDGALCCGSSESDWEAVRRLAASQSFIRPAYGLHPWYVTERSPHWLDALQARLNDPAAGVGEIGLDHALDRGTFAAQEECFLAQIKLAAEWRRPVSLHCRRAWGRLMELLDAHGWPPDGVVLHSYSGSRDLIEPLARRGAFFSFSGAITHERNARGREAAAAVPDDRLLVETDAPDIPAALPTAMAALAGADGRPLSEPAHLVLTLRTLASLRHVPEETLAELTWRNAGRIFGAGLRPV